MPWLCVDHLIRQWVWPMGSSYPDPLAKSRSTGKIQTHWLGHKVVHIVTRNIKKLSHIVTRYIKKWSLVFINVLFIYINLIKPWHIKKTVWLTGAWGRTPLIVTPAVSPETAGVLPHTLVNHTVFDPPIVINKWGKRFCPPPPHHLCTSSCTFLNYVGTGK